MIQGVSEKGNLSFILKSGEFIESKYTKLEIKKEVH